MNQLQMINRMMWGGQKDPNLLLQLLGNTAGNTNGNWIDTSMYATPAMQSNSLYQPILTTDVFGAGNYGYVFDGSNDKTSVLDSSNIVFGNGTSDIAFTVEFTFILKTTVRNTGLFAKIDGASGKYEWAFYYYNNSIRTYIYSGGTSANYLSHRTDFIGAIDTTYLFKMTYDGSGSHNGINTLLNGNITTVAKSTIGTYVAMTNTSIPINIGNTGMGYPLNGAMTDIEIWKGVI